jgi:hypothetical protein
MHRDTAITLLGKLAELFQIHSKIRR